ncbi:MAG: BadF/BadG/BcrA/BcrD ATPase family protein, partial [bacterium]|nr:BadF/BadG/BcrA/BcrD ATPase family protein [bacterium]
LNRLEQEHGLTPDKDRIFFTGSGSGIIAPLVGGKLVQEVVAVAAAVEKLHPAVSFVSEIGGEDMKTIFFTGNANSRSKQVLMQSACSGGTGTFVEKTARKLQIPTEQLAEMRYTGYTLHKISSKCGIFAEADSNTLLKAGVSVEEIIASLFEAVVYQNLATLTRGNTPMPEILLLGGPNLFFKGLQEAWRHHLIKLWKERKVELPEGKEPEELISVPKDALYYAAQGCIEVSLREPANVGIYQGASKLRWWIDEGQLEEKQKQGRGGLWQKVEELEAFKLHYGDGNGNGNGHRHSVAVVEPPQSVKLSKVIVGCDFGSTTAKAVCLTPDKEMVFSCYALSKGNPIEDARDLFRQIRQALGEDGEILGLGVTGYGKDLLK